MANLKITQLAELTSQDIDNDVFVIVDKSDVSMNASGTNKRILGSNIRANATNITYDQTNNNLGDNVQTAITNLNSTINNLSTQGSWLVTGGGIAWDGNLDITVSAATYYIQGVLTSAPQTSLTLDAADPDDPRFDAIVVNSNGTITKITGTPNPTPATPSIDPTTQLALAYIRVDAAATGLVVNQAIVYRENVEWTTSSNSGNIVANSATDPFAGSVCVRATSAASGNAITFTNGSTVALSAYRSLNMFIQFTTWSNAKSLILTLSNTTSGQTSSIALRPGQHGLVAGISTYQLVSIPVAAFPSVLEVNRLTIEVSGGGAPLSIGIDNIELVAFTGGVLPVELQLLVGTSGTDFTIDSSPDLYTFNLPTASGTNRGALSSTDWTTFNNKLSNVVEDTTPQLGGALDVNGNKIVSVSNANIDIEPNGTGNVLLGNLVFDADQSVGAGQNNYVLTYDDGTGLISLEVAASGGITTFNTLTATTQTFATGTAGTDFAIVSDTSTHTFNLPTASAANRGALSAADWTTFNSKLSNVVEDTTPQLGGGLDVNGNKIISVSNGNIDIEPNGTGNVLLGNFTFNADQAVGAGQDNYVLTYDDATGLINLEVSATGGITTFNTLTATTQTFATGTSGTDFAIVSDTSTHTFNLPTASAANRGALSSADWTTFNSKLSNVVEDTTPQLGGALDVNGSKIVSVSNGNIDIEPNGTGNVLIGNFTFDADQTVGAGQDNYVLTYDNGTGLVSLEAAAAGGITTFNTLTATTQTFATGTSGTDFAIVSDTSTHTFNLPTASAANRGALSSADWTTFNSKLSNVVDDTTPQLGGSLDVNGNKIVSASNANIDIEPNGTGNVLLGNFTFNADQTVGAGQDNYVLTYDDATGLINLEVVAAGGITTLNTLTATTQTFATGTSGTDFAIVSDTSTHTFNIPTASAANRGALSSADWTAFNSKLSNVVEDTTPQLGGGLDVNAQKIISVSNGNIDIEPHGTGNVLLGNLTFDADQTVGAGQDNYLLTYDNGTGLISLEVAAPANAITTLNTLTAATQTFAVGTSGTDFAIVSDTATHTFNLPDASTSNRGVVTTGTQGIGGAKTFDKTVQVTERTQTPGGTTATIDLTEGNHQTLDLSSSSGTVTATITVPAGTSAGTIIVVQHGSSARDITWAVSSGTILWDVEPVWDGDAVSSIRIVPWRWNGTQMFLAATGVFE